MTFAVIHVVPVLLSSTMRVLRASIEKKNAITIGYGLGTRFTAEHHVITNYLDPSGQVRRDQQVLILRKVTLMEKTKVHGVSTFSDHYRCVRANIPGTRLRVKRFEPFETTGELLANTDLRIALPPFFEWHRGPLLSPIRQAIPINS